MRDISKTAVIFAWGIVLVLLLAASLIAAQFETAPERKLYQDIHDYRVDDFTLIEAAFILSGANQPDSLEYYVGWYNDLLSTLKAYNFDPFDRVNSADKIFAYLHANWLITYQERATTLIDVVREKRYNCVAGTILYNLICEDLNFRTEAFETPTHTYTIFPNFTETITVENTTPMGFDIMRNLHEYSKHLLRFYPEKQAYQIGLDRIYAYENSKGRRIDNTELLGLLAYNRAYFAREKKDFKTAYDFVLLAQRFNKDSRSNVNFEIDLYYHWGKQLFDDENYKAAFRVYADAYYRYWEYGDLAHNCRASLFKALGKKWEEKEWEGNKELVDDVFDLGLLDDKDFIRLQQIIQNWAFYFYQTRDKQSAFQALDVLTKINPDDPQLARFKKLIEEL